MRQIKCKCIITVIPAWHNHSYSVLLFYCCHEGTAVYFYCSFFCCFIGITYVIHVSTFLLVHSVFLFKQLWLSVCLCFCSSSGSRYSAKVDKVKVNDESGSLFIFYLAENPKSPSPSFGDVSEAFVWECFALTVFLSHSDAGITPVVTTITTSGTVLLISSISFTLCLLSSTQVSCCNLCDVLFSREAAGSNTLIFSLRCTAVNALNKKGSHSHLSLSYFHILSPFVTWVHN